MNSFILFPFPVLLTDRSQWYLSELCLWWNFFDNATVKATKNGQNWMGTGWTMNRQWEEMRMQRKTFSRLLLINHSPRTLPVPFDEFSQMKMASAWLEGRTGPYFGLENTKKLPFIFWLQLVIVVLSYLVLYRCYVRKGTIDLCASSIYTSWV